ncbi:vacuole effluxer Atg22 like-domain-containing protein [Gorgonomyces haynaldii]|nr:vacuole effluxer Atg22 like-domain-containing protein [Gorgonomyces haynaldii]
MPDHKRTLSESSANGSFVDYHDHSPTTPEELRGWYSLNCAVNGFSAVSLAVFMPLVTESFATSVAVQTQNWSLKCDTSIEGYDCMMPVGGGWYNTTDFVKYCHTFAVFIELVLFLPIGTWADFGNNRKRLLGIMGLAAALSSIIILAAFTYKAVALVFVCSILISVFYGLYIVCWASYLPILIAYSPGVRDQKSDVGQIRLSEKIASLVSAKGLASGYFAGTSLLVLLLGLAAYLGDGHAYGLPHQYALQIGVAFTGVVYILIYNFYGKTRLKERPGPPAPTDKNFLVLGVERTFETVSQLSKLPQIMLLLVSSFFSAAAYNTMASIAVHTAQSVLHVDTVYVIACAVIVNLFAGLGSLFFAWFKQRVNWSEKKLLMALNLIYSIVPLYIIIGLMPIPFGMKSALELPVIGVLHGALLGATQSNYRVLLCELYPQGLEAQYFALYEFTNLLANTIMPPIVDQVNKAAGNERYGFIPILLCFYVSYTAMKFISIKAGIQQAKVFSPEEHFRERLAKKLEKKKKKKDIKIKTSSFRLQSMRPNDSKGPLSAMLSGIIDGKNFFPETSDESDSESKSGQELQSPTSIDKTQKEDVSPDKIEEIKETSQE